MTCGVVYEITYTNQRTNNMEQREELSLEQWLLFLVPEKSRELEWEKLLQNFPDSADRDKILRALIEMPEEIRGVEVSKDTLRMILARLIEDSFMLFFHLPSYRSVENIIRKYPRDAVGESTGLI